MRPNPTPKPALQMAEGARGWLPNLGRGVSAWNLADDLNARALFDGRLIAPTLEGLRNLPSRIEWDITALEPLQSALQKSRADVERAFEDLERCMLEVKYLFEKDESYADFHAAFTLPLIGAAGSTHYYYCAEKKRVHVINWGASPGAAAPTGRFAVDVLRFSSRRSAQQSGLGFQRRQRPLLSASSPEGSAQPGDAKRRGRRWLLASPALLAALLIAWLLSRPDASPRAVDNSKADTMTPANQPPTSAAPRATKTTPSIVSSAPEIPTPHQRIYFMVDDDRLTPDQHASLIGVRDFLRHHPQVGLLRIEGHADPRGLDAGNLNLSLRRARRVKTWLIDSGIDGARLQARGCAARYPLNHSGSPQALLGSRRVELYVIAPKPRSGRPPHQRCSARDMNRP